MEGQRKGIVAQYTLCRMDESGVAFPENRYRIVDELTGKVLDDAQGHGYKTHEAAYSSWWWKHPEERPGKERPE